MRGGGGVDTAVVDEATDVLDRARVLFGAGWVWWRVAVAVGELVAESVGVGAGVVESAGFARWLVLMLAIAAPPATTATTVAAASSGAARRW
ncbi:MAG: hypothetical protein DLM58_21475 [Pseudonocardiales bacterium]|nr:MAG: hypothetical protein DLM58_21475 [Pseudonocardiales bacterium]